MTTFDFYAISFLTNASILIFEITGGRLLAPYLGTSVGVWAGLIAVVLGGMAIGYHYGGQYADRGASTTRIGYVLLAAGCAALLAWGTRDLIPTLLTATPLAPTVGALVIGAILFMPTVILLAAISPLLAKNLIRTLETSGRVIGEFNAVGTVGAIVGAIATGLLFIPLFGVSTILLGVAFLVLLLSLPLIWSDVMKALGSISLALTLSLLLNAQPTQPDHWIADISTAYNRIIVTAETFYGPTRAVWTSPFGIQCQMFVNEDGSIDEYHLVEPYQQAHDVVIHTMFPEGPSRALFLGGCIGAFPRYIVRAYPDTDATIVEIDPGMVSVATRLFGFDASTFPTFSFVYEDARVFVNDLHEPYDLIYVDAFGSSGRVPFQLMTTEMFAGVATNLTEEGLLIMNVHGAYEGPGTRYPATYLKTVRSIFPYAELYHYTDQPHAPQNLVIVASHTQRLPAVFKSPQYPDITLTKATLPDNVIVLTDEYAPVEGIFPDRITLNDMSY